MTKGVLVEIGGGELIDKMTILQIKLERVGDVEKVKNIRYELEVLSRARAESLEDSAELLKLEGELKGVNEALWDIEDDIRQCENEKDFGEEFVRLARAVYITNDKRAWLKKEINLLTGAAVVEEKSYTKLV